MSGEHRGNVLKGAVIEYCVHGHFFRSKDDENGRYGAWWVPLRRLVRQLGKEEVKEKVGTSHHGNVQTRIPSMQLPHKRDCLPAA